MRIYTCVCVLCTTQQFISFPPLVVDALCLNNLNISLISKREREQVQVLDHIFIPEAQLAFHELAYTLNGAFHQNDQLNGDH